MTRNILNLESKSAAQGRITSMMDSAALLKSYVGSQAVVPPMVIWNGPAQAVAPTVSSGKQS